MSRATQFAIVAAVTGTLLLATSSAAPQPAPRIAAARIAAAQSAAAGSAAAAAFWAAQRRAVPDVCLATRPCPGPRATICFASTVVREPACPAPKVTYRFAQAPQAERR